MYQLLMFFARRMKRIIIIVLLTICLPRAYSQSFEELTLDQQNCFFEGYWKYTSNSNDTIFILKIKHFDSPNGNIYIGSYLFKDFGATSGNITDLSDFLAFSSSEDFKRIDSMKFSQNKLKTWYSMFFDRDDMSRICGSFYDYVKCHRNGEVTLEVLSAQSGQETISWSLDVGNGTYFYPEGQENDFFTFSVPVNVVFTKINDLTEFENYGIILPPFPRQFEMIIPD